MLPLFLFLFIAGVVGMSQIIVEGSVFEPVRDLCKKKLPAYWSSFVDCYLCTGTWAGFLLGWICIVPFINFIHPFWIIFVCGCVGGFLANLSSVLFNFIEALTIVRLDTADFERTLNQTDKLHDEDSNKNNLKQEILAELVHSINRD